MSTRTNATGKPLQAFELELQRNSMAAALIRALDLLTGSGENRDEVIEEAMVSLKNAGFSYSNPEKLEEERVFMALLMQSTEHQTGRPPIF